MVAPAPQAVDINESEGFINVTSSVLFAKRMQKRMEYADLLPNIW